MARLRWTTIALALALVPATARAQAFHLPEAELLSGDAGVGDIEGLRVTSLAWRGPQRANLRYEDERLSLEVSVDLSCQRTYVAAGVGAAVDLQGTGPWRLEMLGGSWAPVLEGAVQGVRIALPEGLPVRAAWLPAGSPPAKGESELPWRAGPFEAEDQSCEGLMVFSTAAGGPSFQLPEEASVRAERARKGLGPVRVTLKGFALHGFAKLPLRCPLERGLGMNGTGSGCGDGSTEGRTVRLPAGTQLFATATATRPFGRLRRAATGLQPTVNERAMACGAKRDCSWTPPLPTGTAHWIIPFEGGPEPHLLLDAWVRVPAERLEDDPKGGRGFGLCSSAPSDWPRLPTAAKLPP